MELKDATDVQLGEELVRRLNELVKPGKTLSAARRKILMDALNAPRDRQYTIVELLHMLRFTLKDTFNVDVGATWDTKNDSMQFVRQVSFSEALDRCEGCGH